MKKYLVVAFALSLILLLVSPLGGSFVANAQTNTTLIGQLQDQVSKLQVALSSLTQGRVVKPINSVLATTTTPLTRFPSPTVTINQCNNKNHFSMAFILVASTRSELTTERINKLNSIKDAFSNEFYLATKGLATMNTSYPVFTISRDELTEYSFETISKKFYEKNLDIFDFISIYAVNGAGSSMSTSHQPAQNRLNGLGFGLFDNTVEFGSKGRLLGINYERDIDIQENTGTLMHETSHQWCCFAGDNFVPDDILPVGMRNAEMHFFPGLESPYQCATPLGARYWISNGDGTFRMSKDCFETIKFHPFQLYFMGLYDQGNFNLNKKFNIFYSKLNFVHKAVPYKQVSINDIISIEGSRSCTSGQLPLLPPVVNPPIQTIISSYPPGNAIDARDASAGGFNLNFFGGLVPAVDIRFDGAIMSLFPDLFSVSSSNIAGTPEITQTTYITDPPTSPHDIELNLSRYLIPGERIRITHKPSNSSVCLGFLPGDVNGDGRFNATDIGTLRSWLPTAATAGIGANQPLWKTDINRDEVFDAQDLARLTELRNAPDAVLTLPACPGPFGLSTKQSQLANIFSTLRQALEIWSQLLMSR
jgi:hypothetical protein